LLFQLKDKIHANSIPWNYLIAWL